MVGLDTNILIRFSMKDDAKQTKLASDVINNLSVTDRGFISLPVVVEFYWVLDRVYKQSKKTIREAIRILTNSPRLVVQHGDIVETVLSKYPDSDLEDAIIAELGQKNGCCHTLTFDKKAARIDGMQLLA